jgi:hypothetical protein
MQLCAAYARAVFEEESRFVFFPAPHASTVRVPIKPPRDVASDVVIKGRVAWHALNDAHWSALHV